MALLELLSLEFIIVCISALLGIIGYYFNILRRLIRFVKQKLQRNTSAANQQEQR